MDLPQMVDFIDWKIHFFDFAILGAIQVDRFGNINTVCVGPAQNRDCAVPARSGSAPLSGLARRFYVVMARHDRGSFPDASTSSTVPATSTAAPRVPIAALPEGGPKLVISPFGIFDFEPAFKRMRVKSLNPGITPEQVQIATGFELVIDGDPTGDPDADRRRTARAARNGRLHRRAARTLPLA